MTEDEVLQNVCHFPVYYRTFNQSPIALIHGSGYLDMPQVLTRKRISEYLRSYPDLIADWEIWVEDARSASCRKVDNGYAVRPGPAGKPIIFTDKFDAWAEVIVRNIRHIARIAKPKRSSPA